MSIGKSAFCRRLRFISASKSVTVKLADLGLTMAVDNAVPNAGNDINFTLTLTNHGPDAASGGVVTDLLPAGLTYQSSTPGQGAYVSGTNADVDRAIVMIPAIEAFLRQDVDDVCPAPVAWERLRAILTASVVPA